MNGNDSDHAFTRLRCMLVVFGQASVTPLPSIGCPLHDPTHRQRFEARLSFRTAHDLHSRYGPPVARQPFVQRVIMIPGIREDHLQPRKVAPCGPERTRPGPLGHRPRWPPSPRRRSKKPRESTRIWRFRPCTFLPPSIPRCLPPSAVLTDWLSIAAALGVGDRPAWARASVRRTSRSFCQVPSAFQNWK